MIVPVVNEYVHEFESSFILDNSIIIHYEPFEHIPATDVHGVIYIDGQVIQTFGINNRNNEVYLSESHHKTKIIKCIYYYLSNKLVINWSQLPEDHFLNVSYAYDTYDNMGKHNWGKEGF